MKRLLDRNAIITGAAQGMGLAIAKGLYREGARVLLMDVNEEAVVGTAKDIDPDGARALGRRADVTKAAEVQVLVQDLKARWGSVDILVNNAGGALHTPHILEEVQEKDWNLVVDVNLKGTFLCCQAVIPEMAKQRKGTIVNMSALAGHWRASLGGVQYVAAVSARSGSQFEPAFSPWKPATIVGHRQGCQSLCRFNLPRDISFPAIPKWPWPQGIRSPSKMEVERKSDSRFRLSRECCQVRS